MQIPHTGIRTGDRVRVRRRAWSVLTARHYEDCAVVTLRALDPAARGRTRQVIWPFEPVTPIGVDRSPRVVSVKAWRERCRALIASAGTPASLRTASAAAMDLLPHQLEPVLAVLTGRCCRLLIADEVGLGKTIQASLIIAELLARGTIERGLVLAPAHLRDQWLDELTSRFALPAALMDTERIARVASQLAVGTNPWSTPALAVSSIDYVKRPEILPSVAACPWDIVVADEAHSATAGSDREAALRQLCAQAAYVVLVTATPHSGNRRAFLSLCGIGRLASEERFCLFRRTRVDVALPVRRRIHRLFVDLTPAEGQMYVVLDELVRALHAERAGGDASGWLTLGVLHKRAQSSAHSLEQSIVRRLENLDLRPLVEPEPEQQLCLPLDDPAGDLDPADAPPEVGPILADRTVEYRLLSRLLVAVRQVQGRETKLLRLVRLLRALGRRGEPAIVFTEYRDTLIHLQRRLNVDCAILHGGLGRDARRAALASFRSGGTQVLLATDAAGEGLNLQKSCRVVVNLELPWNPMRLEQRIGRVDRIGQPRTVHAFHLIARATRETAMVETLAARIASAQADVGGAADPLGLGHNAEPSASIEAAMVTPVRLAEEAATECARLNNARRFSARRRGCGFVRLESGGPTLSFARRRNGRRLSLPTGGVLAIVQVAFVDDNGDVLASQITPVSCLIEGAKPELQAFLSSLFGTAPPLLRAGIDEWIQRCLREHRAFWNARLERERAIASASPLPTLLQPGLFDRRADRARQLRLEQDQERQASAERWIRLAEHALQSNEFKVRSIAAVAARR